MDKLFFALVMVFTLSLQTSPLRADEMDDVDSKLEDIESRDVFTDADDVSSMPIQGEEQIRDSALPPGKIAQPSRRVNDQIETALDNLAEAEATNALLERENGSLKTEVSKLKKTCDPAKASKKKVASKTAGKKKIAKNLKKSNKVEAKRIVASAKKKISLQKLGTKKRMVASLPRTLPTKKR